MSAPSHAALLANHERVAAMLADPDLHGDLLIVGIALSRLVDFDSTESKFHHLARLAFPCPPAAHGPVWESKTLARVQKVLGGDARRYEPPPASGRCLAPVADRNQPCGEPTQRAGVTLIDPATGERCYPQSCDKAAHVRWLHEVQEANWADLTGLTPPEPAPNTGGVLARHLPEVPWLLVWSAARPGWMPGAAIEAEYGPHVLPGPTPGRFTSGGTLLRLAR